MGTDDGILICGGPASGFAELYANEAAGAVTLRSLLGRLPDPQAEELQAALALPRPIFMHLDRDGDGSLQGRCEMAAQPTPPDADPPVIWVVRLREQALRPGPPPIDLDFADTLPLGLVLFDVDDRLTWCNGTYRRVLGPNAHLLKLGEKFEDIMSAAYRSGHGAGGTEDLEDRIAARMAHHRNYDSFEEALSGGRWLLTQEIATPDGGTLGVRTDITKIKRAGGTVQSS